MAEKYTLDYFEFQDKDVFERAKKEQMVVQEIKKRYFPMEAKNALKLYRKAVRDKSFTTVVGYSFLQELRRLVLDENASAERSMPPITIASSKNELSPETSEPKTEGVKKDFSKKYKTLYDWQLFVNKRLKIVIVALVFLVIAFVVIELKSEYSVFTYFTDYKTKMENDLVNKYESWENDLQQREDALNQGK